MAARLPGKYITAAAKKTKSPKRRMKLAWELWEKAKRAAARLRKGGTTKKSTKKKSTKKKTSSKKTTSSKKSTSKKKSTSAKKKGNPHKKGKRTMKKLVSPKTLGLVTNAGIGALGLVGSTVAFNKIPGIKDWKPWQKMLAQGIVGIIGMVAFLKYKWLFLLFFGGLTGAGATALLELLPTSLKGRRFTPTEMKQLTEGVKSYNNGMGMPLEYYQNRPKYKRMNIPITTNMGMTNSFRSSRVSSSAG